jgi:CheY-like chemotaxis protein
MLFLRQVESKLHDEQQKEVREVDDEEVVLHDKTLLIVDDDMRNAFALSVVLEEKGIQTRIAENGEDALDLVETCPDIDLVLMDIMMPGMDGYETMKSIRSQQKFETLPIIALTAKAMRGDRQKCVEAGANDYLSKPVDVDKLMSLLRVWLR